MSDTKTTEEIIKELVEMVNHRGRSMTGDHQCIYRHPGEHPGCAVGRCLLPDKYTDEIEFVGVEDISGIIDPSGFSSLDDVLIPQYRGHNIVFWGDLQDFHDADEYWNDNNLSNSGIKRLAEIKSKHS